MAFNFERAKSNAANRCCPHHGQPLTDIRRSIAKWTYWCEQGQHLWRYTCDISGKTPKPHWHAIYDDGKPMEAPRG